MAPPQDVRATAAGSHSLSHSRWTMPSSEGEVTTAQIAEVDQVDGTTKLEEETTRMAQVAPEVVIGRSPARINPKRKPDKSKIFRIRTSKSYSQIYNNSNNNNTRSTLTPLLKT